MQILATTLSLSGLAVVLTRSLSSALDKYDYQFEQWVLVFGGISIHLAVDPTAIMAVATAFCLGAAGAVGWKMFSFQESGLLKKHELEYLRGKGFWTRLKSGERFVETKINEMKDEPEPGMRITREYLSSIGEDFEDGVPNCIYEPNADEFEIFCEFGIGRWKYIRREELFKKVFGVWRIYDFFT